MTAVGAKRTRAEVVRDQMREDILSGVMKPGQRLMFPEICARYGTSVGVAREALAGLVSQGLVRAVAHQGHTITPISRADLEELVAARMMIEPLVIKASVSHGGVEWEAALMAAYHRMSRTSQFSDVEPGRLTMEWSQVHDAFHQALFAACGNAKLLDITKGLSSDAMLYRRWSDVLVPERDVMAEHKALLDAAIAGDAELAGALLRAHIERTASSLKEVV
jgi:DNA-binding GntR family transcriptional regulator